MLRRHSTKSRSDLHRRKSITSVRSVPLEYINVAIAQRDAHLAAMEAFSRAQDRQSTEMALFPPQPASAQMQSGSPARISRNNSTANQHHHGGQDDHGLTRRQSVRFVGPDSVLTSRASHNTMHTTAPERPNIPATQSSQNVAGDQTPRPVLRIAQNTQLPDRISSVGKTAVMPETGLSRAYLQALAPEYEQYTPEDDVASMPSSYRRVRKSRSMFTTRSLMGNSVDEKAGVAQGSSATDGLQKINIATSFSRSSFLNRKENNPRPTNTLALRAPKSMSFLKHRRERVDMSESAQDFTCDSTPVSNMYESSRRPRRLLPKTSKFFGSRYKGNWTDSPDVPSSSSPNGVFPTSATGASLTLSLSRHGSMRNKARKVSSSLKSRFRNLFINKSENDAKMPAQQIEAQKTHVSENFDDEPWRSATVGPGHDRERSSLSRVSTRLPSLHAVPSSERLRSRRGSIESFTGDSRRISEERSRVTSWASTETNTVIAHNTEDSTEEWDKQRLSIINELGFHAPSPSMGRQKLGLQTITSQEELAPALTLDRLPPGATVDSQRVYSALMKRMIETRQLAGIVEQQRRLSDSSDPFRIMSPQSTVDSAESSGTTAPLRVIPPRELPCETCKQDDEYQYHLALTSSAKKGSPQAIPASVVGAHRDLSSPIHLTPTSKDAPAAKSITDRSSAFFGTPTSHFFRTRSPYRRSLQEAMRSDQEREEPSVDTTETMVTTPTQGVADKVAYTESIYSDGTQIHNFAMKKEFPVAGHSNDTTDHGDVSVFLNAPIYRPTGQRHLSTASSVEWKAWLSADVEKMEKYPSSPTKVTGRASEVEYALPTMPRLFCSGHVREAAQIGSYEEDEYNSSPAVRMPTNPSTPLGAIDSNVVKVSPRQRSILRTTPPLATTALRENKEPTTYEAKTLTPLGGEEKAPRALPKDDSTKSLRTSPQDLDSNGSCRDRGIFATTTQSATPMRGAAAAAAARQTKSLARLQNLSSRIREPQTGSPHPPASSTVRLMRKAASGKLEPSNNNNNNNTASASVSASTSPAFSGAFERHFGSLLSGRLGGEVVEKENRSPRRGVGGGGEAAAQGQGQGPDADADANAKGVQVRGSRAIVESFLSSRRRQGAGSGDGAAFL